MRLQVEITTRCNLNCEYCLRRFARIERRDMSIETFERILDEFDPDIVALYGFGEPLLHPQLIDMIRKANKRAETVLVTNGTLKAKLERVAEEVNVLGVSYPNEFEGAFLSFVLTKENYRILPKLAEDREVFVSHVNPYSSEIYSKAVFFEMSLERVEWCKERFEDPEDLRVFIERVSRLERDAIAEYDRMMEEIGDVNLERLAEEWERVEFVTKVMEFLKDCNADLPNFFAKERRCPFEDGAFVRVDGKVFPCSEYAYPHPMFVNGHSKWIGTFEEVDKDVSSYPWCGDCKFLRGCWFVDECRDCYGNEPSCSECLASAGIYRCL